jgi:TolB-like protein/Flp pilus assembly protein TadD
VSFFGHTDHCLRFGVFELDPRRGELRRRGLRLELQAQPLGLLLALLERPGELVTREELRRRLWPEDTFVAFDHGINTAVKKVRRALGDSAVNPRFVETLPRQGYRFIAPVEAIAIERPAAPRPRVADSIAVLPFRNASHAPHLQYLSSGLTESLIEHLARLSGPRVLSHSSVSRYTGQAVDPREAGRELGVRAVLTGRVELQGETLVTACELVDVADGWRLWGWRVRRPLEELLELEDEIASQIADQLRLELGAAERERLARRHTEDPEAHRSYLKGRYHLSRLTEEALRRAIECFESAIEHDPRYALAYVGLAEAYGLLSFFDLLPPRAVVPQAKQAAERALALDPELSEAHAALATLHKVYDWDWERAGARFRHALEIKPSCAIARRLYASYLAGLGRSDEALAEMELAQSLDPLSLMISTELGWLLYLGRRYEEAAEQAHKTLEMEPRFPPALYVLGLAAAGAGRCEAAAAHFDDVVRRSGQNPAALAALGHVHATGGRPGDALQALERLRDLAQRGYVSPYWPALVCCGLGESDAALEWLEKASDAHDVWLIWLKVDPRLDPVRGTPRFQELLRRVGLGEDDAPLRALRLTSTRRAEAAGPRLAGPVLPGLAPGRPGE